MERKRVAAAILIILVLTAATVFLGIRHIQSHENKVVLKILCAGSLMFPLEKVAAAFERDHVGVDVQVEGHGSIQVIRQITELEKNADLLMVADYSLIPIMMYNTTIPDTNETYADWCLRFAGNSIVLAYTNQSAYANEINATNWYQILTRPDVKFGFPNPMIDALGYRALFTVQLAEVFYQNDRIFDQLVTENFDPAFGSVNVNGSYLLTVPEVQTPVSGKVILRASSIPLIPLLEAGSIDYCFLYLSNTRQYGFRCVELPVQISLSSPQYEEYYQQVRVKFELQRFGSIGLDREGKTIYYGLTIPRNAVNAELAAEFVEYVLHGEGKTIFGKAWHPVFEPSYADHLQALPDRLRVLALEEP